MQNKNIDSLMSEKANSYLADNSYMPNDFASIKAQLPTSPTTLLKPSSKPFFFNLNIILGLIAVVTVVTLLFIKNKKSSNKNNSSAPIASNSMLNTIAKDTILIDTPVVVNEIPKDPKSAPKKWVYKMQINFAGKTETKLPPKEIVDIEKIAKEETTKKEDIDSREKSKIVIQNFLNQLASPTQLFTINNQEPHHIICKDGTTLKIAPNTFIDLHKKVVQGNVALEIKEAYSYTDIIGNNLHTVSNGNLLQSGGMVYINATQNRQQLDIDIQNPIRVEIPTTNKKDSMQLFNLDKNNWVANGQFQNINQNTSKANFINVRFRFSSEVKFERAKINVFNIYDNPIEYYNNSKGQSTAKFKIPSDCDYTKEEIKELLLKKYAKWYDKIIIKRSFKSEQKLHKQKDAFGFSPGVVGDTINLTFKDAVRLGLVSKKDSLKYEVQNIKDSLAYENRRIQDSIYNRNLYYSNSLIDSAYYINERNYNFNIRNFGWVNCDRFYNIKNKIIFNIEQLNTNQLQVSALAFVNKQILMPGILNKKIVSFSQIPNDEAVVYIAFQYQNDKVLTCIQQFTTSKETAKASEFIELTPAQVKAKLDALGNVKE